MRFSLVLLLSLFVIQNAIGQSSSSGDNEIFIVCRATKNKQNIIAKDFNLKDSLTTHIGLGLKTEDGLRVYNVSNNKKSESGSSLIVESLNEFLEVDDVIDFSLWSFKIDDKSSLKKLRSLIDKSLEKKIKFDFDFSLDNDVNKLYCSEFVSNMLLNSNIIDIEPAVKKLNPFYSRALKRHKLQYIPVDFFQVIEGFQKVENTFIR